MTSLEEHTKRIQQITRDRNASLALQIEMDRARSLFPGNVRLFAALIEEVGELANAILEGKDWRTEVLHVATVAMRIYTEGEATHGLGVTE